MIAQPRERSLLWIRTSSSTKYLSREIVWFMALVFSKKTLKVEFTVLRVFLIIYLLSLSWYRAHGIIDSCTLSDFHIAWSQYIIIIALVSFLGDITNLCKWLQCKFYIFLAIKIMKFFVYIYWDLWVICRNYFFFTSETSANSWRNKSIESHFFPECSGNTANVRVTNNVDLCAHMLITEVHFILSPLLQCVINKCPFCWWDKAV